MGKSYPLLNPPDNEDFDYLKWLLECCIDNHIGILIVDVRDKLSGNILLSIKKKINLKIVTIDDPDSKRFSSDLAFYPPVPQLSKVNWENYEGDLYIGWEFVIVKEDFKKKYRNAMGSTPEILISMGGSDLKGFTEKVVEILDKTNFHFKANIIIGPGFNDYEKIAKKLKNVNFDYHLHKNPNNIAEIMSRSYFGIITFGHTAYELMSLNVPAIYLNISKDHEDSSMLFVKEELGLTVGFDTNFEDSLLNLINYLFLNPKKIKEMRMKSSKIPSPNLDKISKIILEQ